MSGGVCASAETPFLYSYGPEELASLRDATQADNSMQPDRPEDMRPRHHKSRHAGAASKHAADGAGGEEEEDDDDDGGDDDEEVSEWNLRKSAAAALDALASVFKERLLPILFPVLQVRPSGSALTQFAPPAHAQERLRSPDWIVRESAVLAIGAVAEGCSSAMGPQLPQLIQFLQSQLHDKQPLIRSITCWTLGRYSTWIVDQVRCLLTVCCSMLRGAQLIVHPLINNATQDHETFLRPVINDLLRCILDTNKKVQEAACSAFATLEEEAAEQLLPYLGLILQHLMFAYSRYQARNLLILYDAIATLADSIGPNLNQQQFIDILLPPLITTWNALEDNDPRLFPLLECLTSVVVALGTGFLAYAGPVFLRCLRLIETAIVQRAAGQSHEKEFAVCALDLLSGLTEGCRVTIEHVIGEHAASFAALILECAVDPTPDMRQSTFALVGDLARHAIKVLLPILDRLMGCLAVNISNPVDTAACNNACWATGELSLKLGREMARYAPVVLERLITLINSPGHNRSLMENCAITLGRLGLACPEVVAPHLERFVRSWCSALRIVQEEDERVRPNAMPFAITNVRLCRTRPSAACVCSSRRTQEGW